MMYKPPFYAELQAYTHENKKMWLKLFYLPITITNDYIDPVVYKNTNYYTKKQLKPNGRFYTLELNYSDFTYTNAKLIEIRSITVFNLNDGIYNELFCRKTNHLLNEMYPEQKVSFVLVKRN